MTLQDVMELANSNYSDLPPGWTKSAIEELIGHDGIFCDGDWVESKDQDPNGEVRLIQLADIGDGFFKDQSDRFLTFKKSIELNCTYLQKGDILVARLPDPLGRACIFPLSGIKKFVTVVDVCIIRNNSNLINSQYLLYLINSPQTRLEVDKYKSGSTRKRISRKNFAKIQFPIAPLPEQHRIVEKIEELFSELDNGVASLKKALEQLKTYRQAVLKWAFEGKLTEKWRNTHQDSLEDGDTLLEQIKAERKRNGWAYTYLAYLGHLARGKSKHRPRNDKRLFGGKYPFIQTGEVKAAKGILRNFSDTYSEFGLQQSKLWDRGTLCITIAANIAETCFLGIQACFPDSIVGFKSSDNIVNSKFIDYFIQSIKSKIQAFAPATAQKNINLTTLENLIIPFCSLQEQTQIVQEIESRLSVCDQLEATLTENLDKAEALRQSILKRAFEGKLVL